MVNAFQSKLKCRTLRSGNNEQRLENIRMFFKELFSATSQGDYTDKAMKYVSLAATKDDNYQTRIF